MDFIGVSNLFSTNNVKSTFNINRFSCNPIAFNGIKNDSFEHSCADYEKNKERVKRSVDLEIQEYYSKIASENKNIKKIDETKEKLYFIAGSNHFSALARPIVDKYYESLDDNRQELKKLEETSKKLQELLTLKSVLSDENNFDKLANIIIEYRPEYLEKFAKNHPSDSQLLKIATGISKDIDKKIALRIYGFKTLKTLLTRQINDCTRKYCENNAIDLTDKDINRFAVCYVDNLESSFDSFKEGIELAYQNDYTPFQSKINIYNLYIRSLKKVFENYLEVLKNSPYKAPGFDPSLSKDEKIEALRCDKDNFRYFGDSEVLDSFSQFEKYGILEEFECIPYLYDLNIGQNKKAIDFILANNGVIATKSQLFSKYHLPAEYIESLPLKTETFARNNRNVKNKEITFVDMSDDETRRVVEQEMQKMERITPKESKYCYGDFFAQEQEEIPAVRLEKMGFGNLNLLYKLVKKGELKGRLEKVQTPEGEKTAVYVDLKDYKTPEILNKIRANTPVSNLSQFAKELGLTQKQLLQYALDGEVDVISRYLFKSDSTTRYFDKRTPKNKAFIERILFENEVKKQLEKEQTEFKKQRKIERMDALSKFQSFKMSLVWHFCPKTREVASNMAKSDGYLCSLLVKDAQKEEELTKNEEIKVNSYRKQLWSTVGSDELKEGFKKANEILNLYSSEGIDTIEDEEIRAIFKQYGYCD